MQVLFVHVKCIIIYLILKLVAGIHVTQSEKTGFALNLTDK